MDIAVSQFTVRPVSALQFPDIRNSYRVRFGFAGAFSFTLPYAFKSGLKLYLNDF